MIPVEILQKIKRIHITATRLASDVFAGEYKSVFKGRGLEFHQVREYETGDEIRFIDWNVTARSDKAYIKEYIEERELTIMILLDASRSNCFGSVEHLKKEIAAEVASVLAASANKNNDRVGLVIFTDRIEKFIPPRKGHHHILRIIREILYHESVGKKTDIPLCLEYLDKVTTRSTVSFLISDFYASGIEKPLSIANKRHDIIGIRITDPRDLDMPNVGVVSLEDAESGEARLLDTSNTGARERYNRDAKRRFGEAGKMFRSLKIDTVDIFTPVSYTEALEKFFKNRVLKRRLRG